MSSATPTLYVDLDGTLIATDLLIEGALRLLRRSPASCLSMLAWLLFGGKARLKAEIAKRVDFAPASLPYHGEFLAWLRTEWQEGRDIVLASASPRRYVEQIAQHLGMFSAVLSSDDKLNLRGSNKLDAIRVHCADQPFEYAGNAHPDLSVWRGAAGAIVVNPDRGVLPKVRKLVPIKHLFESRRRGIAPYVRTLRLHQWMKNVLIAVPLLTAQKFTDLGALMTVAGAIFAFGLVASATYILNDLLDLSSDRHHLRKRTRPLASGDLSLVHGMLLGAVLLAAGVSIAALISPMFLAVLLTYIAATLAYSFTLKSVMLVDVVCLACLYTLRIVAGAIVIEVEVSNWLLAFSLFLFMSLALVKRCAELQMLSSINLPASAGRDYRVADFPVFMAMGVACGYIAVLVFALFIDSPSVAQQYPNARALWLAVPLFLYWVSRLWVKTIRGEMHDDPLVYSVRDRASWIVFCGVGCAVLMAHWRP
jgi:4-hydroxybenzoate polyprenyltransferase/phosphoserine phosphatase